MCNTTTTTNTPTKPVINFNGTIQFVQFVTDNERIMQHLESRRFKDGVKFCPFCYSSNYTDSEKRFAYLCNGCKEEYTVISKTFLNDGNISLENKLLAIYEENSNIGGITGGEAIKKLPHCRKTVTALTQDIRRLAYNQSYFANRFRERVLKGIIGVYAIDCIILDGKDSGRHDWRKGSYFGGRNRVVVFTITEIGNEGMTISFIVNGENERCVLPIIEKYIPKGSTVYSDQHAGYTCLTSKEYNHQTVNHKEKNYTNGEVTTNMVECWHSFLSTGLYKFRNSICPLYAYTFIWAAIFRFNTRDLTESEKLDIVIDNIFTEFEGQPQKIENYKEAKAAHYIKVDNKRRLSENKKKIESNEERRKIAKATGDMEQLIFNLMECIATKQVETVIIENAETRIEHYTNFLKEESKEKENKDKYKAIRPMLRFAGTLITRLKKEVKDVVSVEPATTTQPVIEVVNVEPATTIQPVIEVANVEPATIKKQSKKVTTVKPATVKKQPKQVVTKAKKLPSHSYLTRHIKAPKLKAQPKMQTTTKQKNKSKLTTPRKRTNKSKLTTTHTRTRKSKLTATRKR